ncbi:hypothetical protein ACFO3I_18030 [Rheinheimera marina]|uniref:Uncharacterized protein n=1 Tax=Rheinheimera marina TaxID=1774958 RepID=A0ABV9JRL5_9GAMM
MTATGNNQEISNMHSPSLSLSSEGRHEQLYPAVDTLQPLHVFHTSRHQLLLQLTTNSADPSAELPPQLLTWLKEPASIRALEKRFIIRQDLFVRNQPVIRSLSPVQLAFLTVLVIAKLTDEYSEAHDLNSLNSAIRLTDHLLKFPIDLLIQLPQLQAILNRQLSLIKQIYDEPTF